MLRNIFFCLFVPLILFGQNINIIDGIPRDTSFNVRSETIKVQKKYPFAQPVISELPEGVIAEENLVYITINGRDLHLDLYRPSEGNINLYPGVILIHGGGWATGDRSHQVPMAQKLASKGYVTAAVEYRLSPEALYPAGIYDLKAAIRWMRANSDKYNIDPDKIAVMGGSAGGELAAFLGTTNGMEKFEGAIGNLEYSSSVQAVVDMDGILDFTHPAESGKDTVGSKPSAGKRWFGGTFKEIPYKWIEASPTNYVNGKTVPILFINSSLDRFHAGRGEMIIKLNKLNIYTEVHTIPDTPHPFWLFHPWFEAAFDYTISFLDKILKN